MCAHIFFNLRKETRAAVLRGLKYRAFVFLSKVGTRVFPILQMSPFQMRFIVLVLLRSVIRRRRGRRSDPP